MAELGQAYVQIIPSAKGISNKLATLLGAPTQQAGEEAGNGFSQAFGKYAKAGIVVAAATAATAATASFVKASISQGAALEQSLGGVETLYKNHADIVIKNANQAFKTAGMSANQYMELATSFSASLLQSLGGDTKKAAQVTDMAMRDMSDNMNKFGTAQERITDAYQGFAKQNYTMLDNLKLGYGGTKSEMERLLADAEKLTGVHYDINNLSDVYSAIHAVQTELGVTGTTAKEASNTMSGSWQALKASWDNTLGHLALGEDISKDIEGLVDSVGDVMKNILPAIGNIFKGIGKYLSKHWPDIIDAISEGIEEMSDWLIKNVPKILEKLVKVVIPKAIAGLAMIAGAILTAAMAAVVSLGVGLLKGVGKLLKDLWKYIKGALGPIGSNLLNAVKGIWEKVVSATKDVLNKITSTVTGVFNNVKSAISNAINAIKNTAIGIWNSIVTATKSAISGVIGVVSGVFNSVRSTISSAINNIKGIVSGIGSAIKGAFSTVKSIMTAPFEGAKTIIQSVINKIKSLFNFKLSFPKIQMPKLPHLRLKWSSKKVFGKTFTYPSGFGISWYAKGGIFNQPSVVGVGEAGPEAVLPIEKLQKMLDASIQGIAHKEIINNGSEHTVNQTINIYQPVSTPAETARAIRRQALAVGLAGKT